MSETLSSRRIFVVSHVRESAIVLLLYRCMKATFQPLLSQVAMRSAHQSTHLGTLLAMLDRSNDYNPVWRETALS